MRVLGIHYGHDSNAAIIEDGVILYAVSEERLNRKKFHRGFPFLSIQCVLDHAGLHPDDIDVVSLVNINAQEEALGNNLKTFYTRVGLRASWLPRIFSLPCSLVDNLLGLNFRRRLARNMLINALKRLGFRQDKVKFVDHHLAHAAGAFFPSGFKEALIFTVDGKGDHVSHRTYVARPNIFEKLHESRAHDSAGFFYTCITSYLGFKKLSHEGKITGLAALGNFDKVRHVPSPLGVRDNATAIKNLLITDGETKNIYRVYLKMLKENPGLLAKWLTSYSAIMAQYSQYRFEKYFECSFNGMDREHVAAFAQKHLEDVIVNLIHEQVKKHKIHNVCLSGGTFGNVRLNQKIAELNEVETVYIQPAMGDGGLGVGGALWEYWSSQKKWGHKFLGQVYLGPRYSDKEIVAALSKHKLSYRKVTDIERIIAETLIQGKIVGRFTGGMEWGPRALGNRTILATAQDAKINQVLNKRLKRTEFMPFAPIILEEFAQEFFERYDSSHLAARFMTTTYDVVGDKRKLIPAVVHVDGTARPQVVRKDDQPSLYYILSEYHALTGIPVLINTSFNMHEEPIVCTPEDAARAYLQGAVDMLAIENHLV